MKTSKSEPRKRPAAKGGKPAAKAPARKSAKRPAGRRADLAPLAGALLEFAHETGTLKNTRRTGWQWRGITQGESIADHCFRVVLLSMMIADAMRSLGETVDTERVLRMAVLHELSEARIGDIPFPAFRYLGRDNKAAAEQAALSDMCAPLGAAAKSYPGLFASFEAGDSPEARIVRAADKLEMLLQAHEYEMTGYRGLQDFFDNERTFADIETHDLLRALTGALKGRREASRKGTSVRWLADGNGKEGKA